MINHLHDHSSNFHHPPLFQAAAAAFLLEKSKTADVASSPSPPDTPSKGTQSSVAVVSPARSSNASYSPADAPVATTVKAVSSSSSPAATSSSVNVQANPASLASAATQSPVRAKGKPTGGKKDKFIFKCNRCDFR